MLKNLKIASVLSAIALVCALFIAGVNILTSEAITTNNIKAEINTSKAIFEDYDDSKKEIIEVDSDVIVKKVLAKNSAGEELGYLYTVQGKNAYGAIKLMVAIKDGKVIQVEFLENGQSFASTVLEHLKAFYPSSEDSTIYLWMAPEKAPTVGSLSAEDIENIDTKCGATFGAETIKELVNAALADAKGGT